MCSQFYSLPFYQPLGKLALLSASAAIATSLAVAAPATPSCKASVLVDAASGAILQESNAHQSLPPASMVKLMLAYTVMKLSAGGSIKLTDPVTVSGNASKIGGSQVYLKQGEQFTIGELLDAVLIQSGNDAAVAIAEHIAGSSPGFVQLMNEQAQQLGMKESIFRYPHGLPPNKGEEPDLASAGDFAILARGIIRDFPELLERTKIEEAPFRGGEFIMRNHNRLLRTFSGTDGLKTGFYNEAGFCVTATAVRNDVRMIAVVMGCDKRQERDEEAARLLATGFSLFRPLPLGKRGETSGVTVPVAGGVKNETYLVFSEEVKAIIRIGNEESVTRVPAPCTSLPAPIKAGTACGEMKFVSAEKTIASVSLVTAEEIAEAGFIRRNWSKLAAKINSLW